MSNMLIRESSDLDDSSEEDVELDEEGLPDIQQHDKKIFRSTNLVDRRLIDLYKLKRISEDRKRRKKPKNIVGPSSTDQPKPSTPLQQSLVTELVRTKSLVRSSSEQLSSKNSPKAQESLSSFKSGLSLNQLDFEPPPVTRTCRVVPDKSFNED